MGREPTFWLAEAFRERRESVLLNPFGVAIFVALCALLIQPSDAVFTVSPYLDRNCTNQLQCGSEGLLCLDGTCQYCTTNTECTTYADPLYRCNTKNVNSTMIWTALGGSSNRTPVFGLCKHKALLDPFHWKDILTFILIFVGACVAAGAGVGGGGLNVAMLNFIDGFTGTSAIPLSSVTIGGAAIANFIHAIPLHRMTAPRPLIDYHSALLLQPLTMGGSIIGILLNRVLPDWFIFIILIIILSWTLYTTGLKFITKWKSDHAPHESPLENPPPVVPINRVTSPVEYNGATSEDVSEVEDTQEVELESITSSPSEEDLRSTPTPEEDPQKVAIRMSLEAYEERTPWLKVGICFVILVVVTFHSIILGGKGGPSMVGIRTCSVSYWLIFWGLFPLLILVSYFISHELVTRYHLKRLHNFNFLDSDIEWSPKRTYLTMVVALFAGILSSLLGVGGGMLINPLLLEMGVAPDATAATSSLMILFTSISASIQYGLLGRIQWDYAAVLFIVGVLGSVVGQHFLGVIVKKYKSQSYILLAMLLIIFPGGVLLVISAMSGLIGHIRAGTGAGFKSMCT